MTIGQRKTTYLDIHPDDFRKNILHASDYEEFILYDDWDLKEKGIEWIIGWGVLDSYILDRKSENLQSFEDWLGSHRDWRMGYINYDLKNLIESDLYIEKKCSPESPLIYFIVPKIVFLSEKGRVKALHHTDLPNFTPSSNPSSFPPLSFKRNTSQKAYFHNFQSIQEDIQSGNYYEMNYCIEWQSDEHLSYPGNIYFKTQKHLQAPFSCYLQLGNTVLICNSPERFLKKSGQFLISQPIKGTSARFSKRNLDVLSKNILYSEKERAENVMIVDLVRNDFAKIATKNTVEVTEFAKIRSYQQTHQLVSTIQCTLPKNISFTQILKATFPMGSMTGAPKISAMNGAEKLESMHRDIYSGTVAYFTPDDDFDCNVVIRSLIHYKKENKSFIRAGGAITIDSDPQKEWEECLLKAESLLQFFE